MISNYLYQHLIYTYEKLAWGLYFFLREIRKTTPLFILHKDILYKGLWEYGGLDDNDLSKTVVSTSMRIAWNTIGNILSRYKWDADPHLEQRFDSLKHIGIDETSYKKAHKYIIVIVDHDTNGVIWIYDKHGKEILGCSLNSSVKNSVHRLNASQRMVPDG